MKEKIPADSATASTSCEQVTFSLPLYGLKEFSNNCVRSTFPCEGVYVAKLPDQTLHMVDVPSLQDGYFNTFPLPISIVIEHAVGVTKEHLLDDYLRNMSDAIGALEKKIDALTYGHDTLHNTVQENFKTVHLNHDEDSTDYRNRLESARQELKDAVDHLYSLFSASSTNNKGGVSEEGLIKIIDSVRK